MIQNTAHELNVHLQRVDEKLADFPISSSSTSGIDLPNEIEVTKQCLRICEDAKQHLELTRKFSILEVPNVTDNQHHDSFQAQLLARQALDENRDSFANIISQIRNRLESLVLKNNPDDHEERSRLLDDISTSNQCLEICKVANEVSSQKTYKLGEAIVDAFDVKNTGHNQVHEYEHDFQENTSKSQNHSENSELSFTIDNGKGRSRSLDSAPLERKPEVQRVSDEAFAKSLHESSERIFISDADSNDSEVWTSQDIHLPISRPASICGESSLTGATLVGSQLQAGDMDPSHITLNESKDSDCMSIVSNDEDIRSRAARLRTEPELLALRLFGASLARLEDLHSLHETLFKKLGTNRFVENYRRILKLYVLELKQEARTPLEKDTAKVMENRENRRSIALQIVAYMAPDDDNTKTQFDSLGLQQSKTRSLEEWARNTYGPPDLPPTVEDSSGEESEDQDNDDLEEEHQLCALELTNIDKACQFLQKNNPLQTLILQLRLLALPLALREIMVTTPRHEIHVSTENDTSFLNRYKRCVESYTASRWDWWPLQSRVPDLIPGQSRLEWKASTWLHLL
jgi:hypothetical protein